MASSGLDRTVHAASTIPPFRIVRYDRAGKWYREYNDGTRHLIGVRHAARIAVEQCDQVLIGAPGGSVFDKWVRKMGGA